MNAGNSEGNSRQSDEHQTQGNAESAAQFQRLFAKNVRIRRKAAHLSQAELAELAGMHRTYIGGIEQGRVNVSLKNITRIAEVLGVSPALLFVEGATPGNADESYALAVYHGGTLSTFPLRVKRKDLTVQVLCHLIESGLNGDELVQAYEHTVDEIENVLGETG